MKVEKSEIFDQIIFSSTRMGKLKWLLKIRGQVNKQIIRKASIKNKSHISVKIN
jgi:hypothetical protein